MCIRINWIRLFVILGTNTVNLTVTNHIFLQNPSILFWSFTVIYSFASTTSSSALNFKINQPPINGSCTINPRYGTINTLFTIICSNWIDEHGIKHYSFYGMSI